MKAGIASAIALAGTLTSGAGLAADGNALLRSCKAMLVIADKQTNTTSVNDFDLGQCIGVTEAVRNTMMSLDSRLVPEMRTCFPANGVINSQGIRIVVRYLEAHPENLDLDQSLLSLLAYKQAYPCKG